jgi:hypothetical protein
MREFKCSIREESSSRNGETRVLKTDRSGKVLGSFGISGRGVGQLAGAHALAVTAQKEIYVAEVFNWRVEKFIPAGAQAAADRSFDSDRSNQVSGSIQLSPKCRKLRDAFVGKWKVTESFEVSASTQGKTRQGTASFRLGPGASLIEDYQSNGSAAP